MIGEADDAETVRDVQAYIKRLPTLMIAYAVAGIELPSPPENLATKSVDYVKVPLDWAMRYVYRAQEKAMRVPEPMQLEWLKKHDEEWAVWVDEYARSDFTLGEVIRKVMAQREASWEPPRVDSPRQWRNL